MKHFFQLALGALMISFFAVACSSAPEGEKVAAGDAAAASDAAGASFDVVTANSVVIWTGSKPTGQHTGTMNLTSGNLKVADGNIVGGEFTIDVNSLVSTDLTAETGKADLEGHLKSADFFDVATHPTATFVVTKCEAVTGNPDVTHNLTGNLTLKGVAKSVTIPANVVVQEGAISAVTPSFVINRTDWGVKYGSGLIGTAKDKLINDEVGLVIQLQATKTM